MSDLRIKEILSEKGLNNTYLQEKLGLSKQYVSNVVTGRQSVSLKRLEEIALALGVDVWQLFADPEDVCGTGVKPDNDFVAMARFRGEYFHADSIDELEKLIQIWKEQTIQERKK